MTFILVLLIADMTNASGSKTSIVKPQKEVCISNTGCEGKIPQAQSDLRACLEKAGYKIIPCENSANSVPKIELTLKPVRDTLSPAEISIITAHDGINIVSNSESGLNSAVYAYLNTNFGCQWIIPGELGSAGPKKDAHLPAKEQKYELPYLIAVQQWGQSEQWHTRMGKITDRKIEVFHVWHKIVSPDKYFSAHPDFFALIKSERKPYQVCTSNKHVKDIFIRYYLDYFEKNPGLCAASISPEDRFNFCECSLCRALDKTNGSITDRLVIFFNEIIREVNKKYPDKKLAFYAYLNYTDPPVEIVPDKNLIPVVCHTPWEFCHNHAITDTGCTANRRFKDILRRWAQISPEVYVREYYGHFLWYGLWPILHSIEEDSRYFRRIGIKGVISESHEHWGPAGWVLYGAGRYLAGEDKPYEELIAHYCDTLYPQALKEISEYILILERNTRNVACRRMDLVLYPENMEKLYTLLDKCDVYKTAPAEKELIGLVKGGLQVTDMLIKIKQRISAGDLAGAYDSVVEILDLADKFRSGNSAPPVVKYSLFTEVMAMFRDKYEKERDYFYDKFNVSVNEHFRGRLNPIKHWLATDRYADIYQRPQGIAMYPDFYERGRSMGLDFEYPAEKTEVRWEKVRYGDGFFSLSEYFPYRCDSIRYYKKVFTLNTKLKGSIFVRAIDGYKIILDGKPVAISKERRFDKKRSFDFVDIELSEGEHTLILKVESSSAMELDDFTVMIFDNTGRALPLD